MNILMLTECTKVDARLPIIRPWICSAEVYRGGRRYMRTGTQQQVTEYDPLVELELYTTQPSARVAMPNNLIAKRLPATRMVLSEEELDDLFATTMTSARTGTGAQCRVFTASYKQLHTVIKPYPSSSYMVFLLHS